MIPYFKNSILTFLSSKIQSQIQRSYKLMRNQNPEFNNFFRSFKALAPVSNHPATLLQDVDDSTDDEDTRKVKWWWKKLREKFTVEELSDISAGYKVVLLLHILLMAEKLNEKVLIFSGCLKTLSFIEGVLQSDDWQTKIPGLPI